MNSLAMVYTTKMECHMQACKNLAAARGVCEDHTFTVTPRGCRRCREGFFGYSRQDYCPECAKAEGITYERSVQWDPYGRLLALPVSQ